MSSMDENTDDAIKLGAFIIIVMLGVSLYLFWTDDDLVSKSIWLDFGVWMLIGTIYMLIFRRHLAKKDE